MRKQTNSKILSLPGHMEFNYILGLLNAGLALRGTKDVCTEELRKLVAQWQESGPNLIRMLSKSEISIDELQAASPAYWWPTSGAGAIYVPQPRPLNYSFDDPIRRARYFFALLVMIPRCELLAGPCKNCGRYFIRKTLHRRIYCSRKCGIAIKSGPSREEERKLAKAKRIAWAKEAIEKWSSLRRRPREGWKYWVAREINEQENTWALTNKKLIAHTVTPKSLTRWVNEGKIQEPTTDRERKSR